MFCQFTVVSLSLILQYVKERFLMSFRLTEVNVIIIYVII